MLGQSKWLQLGKGEAQMNNVPRWEVQIRAGVGYDTTERNRATRMPHRAIAPHLLGFPAKEDKKKLHQYSMSS